MEMEKEWYEGRRSDKTAAVDVDFVGAEVDSGSAGSDGTRRMALQLRLNGLQAKHEQSLEVDVDVNVEADVKADMEEEDVDGTIRDGDGNGEGDGDGEGGGDGHRCT